MTNRGNVGSNSAGSGPSVSAFDRRELLGLVAGGTVGLAGCLGGGGQGNNGTTTGEGAGGQDDSTTTETEVEDTTTTSTATEETEVGDTTTETTSGGGSGSCSEMTAGGYTRYDEDGSPFVATFEHAGDVVATGTFNANHGVTIRHTVKGGKPFDMFAAQKLTGTDAPTAAQKGDPDGLKQVGELQFGGETRPIIRADAGDNGDPQRMYRVNYPYFIVGLPHEGSAGKKYYRLHVNATVESADELKAPDCQDTYENTALHVVNSLEPNPDTTVESNGD